MRSPHPSPRIRWLGWVSLLANAVLLLWLSVSSYHQATTSRPTQPIQSSPTGAARMKDATSRSHAERMTSSQAVWQRLKSGDFAGLRDQLRAMGCPESTVQEVLLFALAREFQARALAAESLRFQDSDFAMHGQKMTEYDRARREVIQLRTEIEHQYAELLGVPFKEVRGRFESWGSKPDFLPSEKRQRLDELRVRQEDASMAINFGGRDEIAPLDPDQKRQLQELEDRRQEGLRAILSPEEFREYERRESDLSHWVRRHFPPAKDAGDFDRMLAIAKSVGANGVQNPWFDEPNEARSTEDRLKAAAVEKYRATQTPEDLARADQAKADQEAQEQAIRAREEVAQLDNKLPEMKADLVGKLGGLKMDDNAMDHFLADFIAQAKVEIPAQHAPGLTPEQKAGLEQQSVQTVYQSMQRHFGDQADAVFQKLFDKKPPKP